MWAVSFTMARSLRVDVVRASLLAEGAPPPGGTRYTYKAKKA